MVLLLEGGFLGLLAGQFGLSGMLRQLDVSLDDGVCGITDYTIFRGTQSVECKSPERNFGSQFLLIRTLQDLPPIIIAFILIDIILTLEVIGALIVWTLEFLDFPLDVRLKLLELLVSVLVFLEHIKEFLGFILICHLLLNSIINCECEVGHFGDLDILNILDSDFLPDHYIWPDFPLQTEFSGSRTNLFAKLLFLTLHFSLFLVDRLFDWLILFLVEYGWFNWGLWFLQ